MLDIYIAVAILILLSFVATLGIYGKLPRWLRLGVRPLGEVGEQADAEIGDRIEHVLSSEEDAEEKASRIWRIVGQSVADKFDGQLRQNQRLVVTYQIVSTVTLIVFLLVVLPRTQSQALPQEKPDAVATKKPDLEKENSGSPSDGDKGEVKDGAGMEEAVIQQLFAALHRSQGISESLKDALIRVSGSVDKFKEGMRFLSDTGREFVIRNEQATGRVDLDWVTPRGLFRLSLLSSKTNFATEECSLKPLSEVTLRNQLASLLGDLSEKEKYSRMAVVGYTDPRPISERLESKKKVLCPPCRDNSCLSTKRGEYVATLLRELCVRSKNCGAVRVFGHTKGLVTEGVEEFLEFKNDKTLASEVRKFLIPKPSDFVKDNGHNIAAAKAFIKQEFDSIAAAARSEALTLRKDKDRELIEANGIDGMPQAKLKKVWNGERDAYSTLFRPYRTALVLTVVERDDPGADILGEDALGATGFSTPTPSPAATATE